MPRPEAIRPRETNLHMLQTLLDFAESVLPELPTYITRYLSDYARAAGPEGWQLLAEHPAVLARLEPRSVAADAIRTRMDGRHLPNQVAAVLLARGELLTASSTNRPGLSQLAVVRAGGRPPDNAGDEGTWSVRQAILSHESPSIELQVGREGIRSVTAYVTSEGGPRLAVGDTVGRVRIWDPVTGTVMATLAGHVESVRASLVPAIRRPYLVTAGEDGTVQLWDLTSGRRLDVRTAGAPIWALQELGGGRFVSGAYDGSVRMWDIVYRDVPTPRLIEVGALPLPEDARGPGRVDALAALAGYVIVGRHDGRVEWWSVEAFAGDRSAWLPRALEVGWSGWNRGFPAKEHTAEFGGVRALAATTLHDETRRVFIGYSDGVVRSWDLHDAEPRPFGPELDTRTMVMSRAGLVLGNRHDVVVLDPQSGSPQARLRGHSRDVRCASIFAGLSAGLLFASGAEDGSVRCWMPWSPELQDEPQTAVRTLVVVATGRTTDRPVLAAGTSGQLLVFADGVDRPPVRSSYPGEISAVGYLNVEGAASVLVGAGSGPLMFYDLVHGSAFDAPDTDVRVTAICTVAGSGLVIAGYADGQIMSHSIRPSSLRRRARPSIAGIVSIQLLTDTWREQLLVATAGGELHTLDPLTLESRPPLWTLTGPPVPIKAMTAYRSWNGTPLVVVSRAPDRRHDSGEHRPEPVERRSELLLIDPAKRLVTELLAHEGIVRALTTVHRPDGTAVLVSGDGDGRVAFSDPDKGYLQDVIEIGQPVLSLAGYEDGVAIGTPGGLIVLRVDAIRRSAPSRGPDTVRWRPLR